MQEYRFTWKVFVGAGIVFLLMLTIFLPGFSISGSNYIDSVISIDKDAISSAEREDLENRYDDLIREKTSKSSVSRLVLAKWGLTIDNDLEFDGIILEEGRKLGNTGIKSVLRFWGWLIYIPFLLSMITIVFMLVKRRTYSGLLLANALVAILCEVLNTFCIPAMLWQQGKSAIVTFDLLSEEVLNKYGNGEKFVQELLGRCEGYSWLIVISLGCLLLIFSILCMTVWRSSKKENSQVNGYDYVFQQNPDVWDQAKSEQHQRSIRATGEIRGIRGEYAGQSMEIHSGEEIVLGRDPQYSMLVFTNPKVSRRQCGIRYDANTGNYQAIDYSSKGTTLSDGTLLTTSEYTTLLPGTAIYIASGAETFLVV